MNEYEDRARQRKVSEITHAAHARFGSAVAAIEECEDWGDQDWREFAEAQGFRTPSDETIGLVWSALEGWAAHEQSEADRDPFRGLG